ncbi:MAG: hypothetical protein WC525_01915 [Candidatus Thermoplasmatota archaeon]
MILFLLITEPIDVLVCFFEGLTSCDLKGQRRLKNLVITARVEPEIQMNSDKESEGP